MTCAKGASRADLGSSLAIAPRLRRRLARAQASVRHTRARETRGQVSQARAARGPQAARSSRSQGPGIRAGRPRTRSSHAATATGRSSSGTTGMGHRRCVSYAVIQFASFFPFAFSSLRSSSFCIRAAAGGGLLGSRGEHVSFATAPFSPSSLPLTCPVFLCCPLMRG